jgi:hypothetical protein
MAEDSIRSAPRHATTGPGGAFAFDEDFRDCGYRMVP